MTMSTLKVLQVVLFIGIIFAADTETNSNDACNMRYRRSWYSLTPEEQSLYITGFEKIRKNGKLSTLSWSYFQSTSINELQDSSLFFFFHEHLVFELENAIRSLRGIYECFSMPYWDFTIDAGLENNAPIFTTGLGGDGDNENNYCINSMNWNLCNDNNDDLCYWTPFQINCAETEITASTSETMCCLKRSISTTRTLTSSAEIAFAIFDNQNYEDFTNKIKTFTHYVHAFIGSVDIAPMSNMMAPEDPIFFLLSSFIGYIRSLWSDCNDFDIIPITELQHHPNIYKPFQIKIKNAVNNQNNDDNHVNNYDLDDSLNQFFYDLNDAKWSKLYNSDKPISVRNLYDISEQNILYELGTFFKTSKLNTWCNGHINDQWFVNNDIIDDDINNINIATSNRINEYIDKTWDSLDKYGLNNDDKLEALSALSCDYVRRTSLNSCFNGNDMLLIDDNVDNGGMCNDMNEEQLQELTLNDLYDYIGDDNECLLKIRSETWSYSKNNIILKQSLCSGGFDYQCNVWIDDGYNGYDDLSGIIGDESSDTQHIVPSSDTNFLSFNTSLWSVLVWCSMFIFIFLMCCYMFTVKKDYETEAIYKKHRKNAHVAIYGSVGAV